MQPLTLALSPCPNDTFIFDAMLHGKIDTEGLSFTPVFADVEKLNEAAKATQYDITKLSYHAFAYVSDDYALMRSGSALGNNCGPLLIAKSNLSDEEIIQSAIAIPGKLTTANFLFSLRYPQATNKSYILFSEIEDRVISSEFDAGVIIHENRFTYEQKGLKKIIDLGEYWELTYSVPIPLGGIAIKRDVEKKTQFTVERVIRKSIEFAFANPDSAIDFVRKYSQEMSDEVCRKHIELYVNRFSLDLGKEGMKAVETLYKIASERGIIPAMKHPLFV